MSSQRGETRGERDDNGGREEIGFACSCLVPMVEGNTKKGWENYTVGPVAGGRSGAVVPLRFKHASDAHLVVSTFQCWKEAKKMAVSPHGHHRRQKRSCIMPRDEHV
jgi:hypothetical protein